MRVITFALSIVLLTPAAALACPVCGPAGTQDNWQAYLGMTVLLSTLPLGMIGGLAYWVYRKSK